jgi:hypothetical protein
MATRKQKPSFWASIYCIFALSMHLVAVVRVQSQSYVSSYRFQFRRGITLSSLSFLSLSLSYVPSIVFVAHRIRSCCLCQVPTIVLFLLADSMHTQFCSNCTSMCFCFPGVHSAQLLQMAMHVSQLLSTKMRCGRSGPEAGRSAVRTVRACGPDGPRTRRVD